MPTHHHHVHSHHSPVQNITNDDINRRIEDVSRRLQSQNFTNIFEFARAFMDEASRNTTLPSISATSSPLHDDNMHGDHMMHDMSGTHTTLTPHSVFHDGHNAHDHGSHAADDHGMATYFYFGYENVQMILQQWRIDDIQSLIISCVMVAVLTLLSEWLRVWRDNRTTQMILRVQCAHVNGTTSTQDGVKNAFISNSSSRDPLLAPIGRSMREGLRGADHIALSVTYTIQQLISLVIMLVFMTFNLYLCMSIVFAHGLGYYLFAWQRMVLIQGATFSETGGCH